MSKRKINSLKDIEKNNAFALPDNYFETFEDKLLNKISDEISEEEEFSIPENYFDDLELRLLKASSENVDLKIPENYFDKLEQDIFKKTINETKVISISDNRLKKISTYVASIAAVVLIAFSIVENINISQNLYFDNLVEENTLAFSSNEIYDLLNDEDLSIESLSINYEIDDDEALEYLSNSEIFDQDLFNE